MHPKTWRAACAGFISLLAVASARAQVFSSSGAIPIPDSPTAVSDIVVFGGPSTINDVNIVLHIDHTWDSDLDIILVAPGAADYLQLSTDNGGSADNYNVTRFDDAADVSISGGATAPFNGNFRPEGGATAWAGTIALPATPLASLAALNGRDADGTWRLLVDDDTNQQTGTLRFWSLEFNGAVDPNGPPPVTGQLHPDGVGVAVPPGAERLEQVLLSVQVTPAENPTSTGLAVRVDASSVGASPIVILRDDGTQDDDVAGDLNFKARIQIPAGAAYGERLLPLVVSDSQGRSGQGQIALSVLPPPSSNDDCVGAMEIPSSGPFPYLTPAVTLINNNIEVDPPLCTGNTSRDVWYRFTATNTSRVKFSTCFDDAPGVTVPDTVMSLFESLDGTCSTLQRLACLDDSCGLRQSIVYDEQLIAGRVYYIQLARFGLGDPTFGADVIRLFVDPNIDESGPRGVGAVSPAAAHEGDTVLFTVAVTPGSAPVSTGLAVALDASSIDAGIIGLNDLGTNGDLLANDLVFSAAAVIPQTARGARQLSFVVTDAQGRASFGDIAMRVLPPASENDTCAGAIAIPAQGPFPYVTAPVDVQGNNPVPERAMCADGRYTAWFSFTPSRASFYEFSTCDADASGCTVPDTVMSVYTGACGSLNEISCVDDGGCGLRALVRPVNALEPGRTYYIQVGKPQAALPADALSSVSLAVRELPPAGACCTADGCVLVIAEECQARGGSFMGVGVLCESGGTYVREAGSGFASLLASGTRLTMLDDGVVNVPLGFAFPFFGEIHQDVYVCANGFISFGRGHSNFLNTSIPSAEEPNACIYALWDDLNPGAAGEVRYLREDLGEAGHKFTVQWTNVPQFQQSDHNTFQIVLFEHGEIELRYGDITAQAGAGDYTVGIEDRTGTRALVVNPATELGAGRRSFRFRLDAGESNCCPWTADGCYADYDNSGGIDADDVVLFFGQWDIAAPCADVDGSGGVDSDDVTAFFAVWDVSGVGTPACGSGCGWTASGCYADFDGGSGIDGDDVIAFFAEWDAGGACADVDGSGGVDSDDVTAFFSAWDAGAC